MLRELPTALRDPQRVDALRRTALLDSPPEDAFDRLARLARRLLGGTVALVSLVEEDRQFFKSCVGLTEPWATLRETPLSHSFCQHAVVSEEPFVVEDARSHPLVSGNRAIDDLGVVAYAGIPLKLSSGQTVGTLCVIDDRPRAWNAEDIATLADLATAVVTEIELRSAILETERRDRYRALLLEAGPMLAASLDPHETARNVTDVGVPVLADWAVVKLFDESVRLEAVAVTHTDRDREQALVQFLERYVSRPEHPARAFVASGETHLFDGMGEQLLDAFSDDPEASSLLRSLDIGSAIVAPLRARGRALGIFVLVRGSARGGFGKDELHLAELLAQRAALAIDNARLYSELDAERHRLRRVLEQMHQGVVTVDGELRVRFANEAAHRIHGFEHLRIGEPLPDPWESVALRALVANLFTAAPRELLLEHSPAPHASYSVLGIVSSMADEAVLVVTDLSEISRLEAAEREFIANAAHELRTPLTAISGAIEVLQAGAKEIPLDRDVFLADIEREAARLRRLTRGLLLLAEIQAQKEPPTVESVDVGALLEDAACGLQTRPGVDVEVVCEPGLRARTNPDLAAQALASVAANAAKYTIRGRIVLRAAAGEGGVTIAVADTGPGINAETQRRMVERFYRGDARAGDGFGLGLSIAAQAVDSLGGSLDFASSTEGTTVKICLPEPS